MSGKEITLQEVEDKLDAISQEPEKYIRDSDGNLVEAITSSVSAVGRQIFFTDSGNADIDFKYGRLKSLMLPNVDDRLRGALGSYWTNRHVYTKNQKELSFLRKSNSNPGTLTSLYGKFSTPQEIDTGAFGATREWVLLMANTKRFKTKTNSI